MSDKKRLIRLVGRLWATSRHGLRRLIIVIAIGAWLLVISLVDYGVRTECPNAAIYVYCGKNSSKK